MIILGIETSCDETAVSVVVAEGDLDSLGFKVLGSAVHSQIEIHKPYGGVFPTLAKREHIKNLPIVYKQALSNAKIKESEIEIIAVTVGPGLEPALWTGINFAEDLSKKLKVPAVPANHMEGHIASVLFNKTDEFSISNIQFPILALLISGGHTELVYLKSWTEKEKIGETKDDAVGEAFDKVARMLGLPYPGGPEISALAEIARKNAKQTQNNAEKILYDSASSQRNSAPRFPRPMIHSKDFDFSFSGLKTAVLYYLRNLKNPFSPQVQKCTDIFLLENSCVARLESASQAISESRGSENFSKETVLAVAREFEDAVIETLISKTKKALDELSKGVFWDQGSSKTPFDSIKTLVIGGGVIANKALRENFLNLKKYYPELKIMIPEKSLTTDNATMIAAAGFIEYLRGKKGSQKELRADGNLDIN